MESCFFWPAPVSVSVLRSGLSGSCCCCSCLLTNCLVVPVRCLGFYLVLLCGPVAVAVVCVRCICSRSLVLFSCVQHYILAVSYLVLFLSPVHLFLLSVLCTCSRSCVDYLAQYSWLSGPVICPGPCHLACSCPGCCSSCPVILFPVCRPVQSCVQHLHT